MGQKAVREALETREDLAQWGIVETTKSQRRTMKAEDREYAREPARCAAELWDEEGDHPMPDDETDPDNTYIRSPVTVNHYHGEEKLAAATTQVDSLPKPPPASEPAVESEPAWKAWLKRAALAAGGLGAGAGGLAGYNALTKPAEQPPAVEKPVYTDSYMEYGVEVLPSEK